MQSGEVAQKLASTYKDLTIAERNLVGPIFYNEACTWSIQGEPVRALMALANSFNMGFNGIDLLDSDEELDPLRPLVEFQSLHRKVETAYAAATLARNKAGLFPFDVALADLEGKTVKIADLRGKIVVITLWTSQYVPARKQLPLLAALDQRYRDKGVVTLAIAIEETNDDASKQAIRDALAAAEAKFPCLLGNLSTQQLIPNLLGYPTTLFLDGEGKVRFQESGFQPYQPLDVRVQVLLEEKEVAKTADKK